MSAGSVLAVCFRLLARLLLARQQRQPLAHFHDGGLQFRVGVVPQIGERRVTVGGERPLPTSFVQLPRRR